MNVPIVFSFQFFGYFLLFCIALLLGVYIPGNLAVRKLKLPTCQSVTLSFIAGIVFLSLQGYLFGYLNLRFLAYAYVGIITLIWLYKNKKKLFSFDAFKTKLKFDGLFFFIMLLGVFGQVSGIWSMGLRFIDGIHFAGGNILDNNLELAITNELIHRFPPFEPGMYGVLLQNYHYWSHLFSAELIRIFHLPLVTTQYQFLTVFISILLGLSVISLSKALRLGNIFTRWLLFYLYFGADFTFGLLFILGKSHYFDIKSMENGAQFLFNLPRAFSIVIFFGGLNFLVIWLKNKTKFLAILCGTIFGAIIGFKIYVGIFTLAGLTFLTIYFLIKKNYRFLFIPAIAFALAGIIYFPVNNNAGGLFFTGFWRVNDFIVLPQLGLSHFELAREIYASHQNYLKVYMLELFFLTLYLLNTFGTKILGLLQTRKSLSKIPLEINLFLIPSIFVSMIAGLFFLQYTGGANTFNFIVNVLIIGSIYAALTVTYFVHKLPIVLRYIIIVIIIMLTIPRWLNMTASNIGNYSKNYGLLINNNQLYALNYLRIYTPLSSLVLASNTIGNDYNSPYVCFLADRPTYYSGIIDELEAHGINYKQRKSIVKNIFTSSDKTIVIKALEQSHINYLLLSNNDHFALESNSDIFSVIFKNSNFRILKITNI